MTRVRMVLSSVMVLAIVSSVWAEGNAPAKENRYDAMRQAISKTLTLTGEQQSQLDQIFTKYQKSLKAWKTENSEVLEQAKNAVKAARKNRDKAAYEKAIAQIRETMASRKELTDGFRTQLTEVLGKENMGKVKGILQGRGSSDKAGRGNGKSDARHGRRPEGPMAALAGLNLTDSQKVKVKIIFDEAKLQAAKTTDEKLKNELMVQAFEKVRGTVLTPQQREKLKSMQRVITTKEGPRGDRDDRRGRGRGPSVDLSDEQKQKAKALFDEARKKASQAKTGDERRAIMREAYKKYHEKVLSEKQRGKMAAQRKERGEKMAAEMKKRFKTSPFGKILNEKQQEQFFATMKAAREKFRDADGWEQRREIMKNAMKKFRDDSLSEDQQQQWDKAREDMKKRWEQRRKQWGQRRSSRSRSGGGEGKSPRPDAQ